MSDRELVERAATAYLGPANFEWNACAGFSGEIQYIPKGLRHYRSWTPLSDNDAAFRLAVAFKMQIIIHNDWVEVLINGIQMASCDSCYASEGCMLETARRSVVKAAAATVSGGTEL